MAADDQKPHGGHPGVVGLPTDGQESAAESPEKTASLQMTRNPMVHSQVQSAWLQMARSPVVYSTEQSAEQQMGRNPWRTPQNI